MDYNYNPTVSIIIPVYNGSNYLAEAIDSALAQTYQNIEIIVVNDGSNDEGATERIAKSYGEKIRYFAKENGGVSSALNLGIRKMHGEWFSWLSHDDLYTPKKIEHSIDALREQQLQTREKMIVYTDGLLVKANRAKIKAMHKYFGEAGVYSGEEAAYSMASKGALCGCCLLIPRKAFDDVGFFDETLRYSQDALMWYSLFLSGYSVCYSANRDVFSRVHKLQVTNMRKDLFYHDSRYVAERIAPLFLETERARKLFFCYLKKLTRLNCPGTFEYMITFAQAHKALSQTDTVRLNFERIIGKMVSYIKVAIKKAILR